MSIQIGSVNAESAEARLRKELASAGIDAKILQDVVVRACRDSGLMAENAMHAATAPGPSLTRRTPLQAAADDSQNIALIRNVTARARRLGYEIHEDQMIDVVELNRALANKDALDRMALKTDLARLRLIA